MQKHHICYQACTTLPLFSFLPSRRSLTQVKTEALHAALTHGIIRKMPAGAKQEWQSAHHVHTHEHHRQPRTETTPPAKSRLGGKPRAVTFSAPDAQAQNATANTDPVSTIARPLTFPSPAAAPSTRPAAIADQQSSQAHAAVPRDIVPDVPSAALKVCGDLDWELVVCLNGLCTLQTNFF